MADTHVDVLIVGAGISGIGAAYHLQTKCPNRSYAILEGRADMGGTWDLFRYPGIRSDSDMYTLGYSFRPWTFGKAIAKGETILQYLKDTAREFGIDHNIRFNHRVTNAAWSTKDASWRVTATLPSGETKTYVCNFLLICTGYYKYEAGYTPDFPGVERFKGRIVHPQKWTDDVDYKNKRVVIIGSGATAVTLLPELAKQAAHVTMLQRSPTYVLALPDEDVLAKKLRGRLPPKTTYDIVRWKNVLLSMFFYQFSKRRPDSVKKLVAGGIRRALGSDFDMRHFTPSYEPWDQRMCFVPNGDMFKAIRSGAASVVTDHIETFTERGIKLRSGQELEADLIVTATGLDLQLLGGATFTIDGKVADPAQTVTYKGMMFSDVPNLACFFGYTNASWTLKCDLTGEYVCRLLNYMDKTRMPVVTPRRDDSVEIVPWLDLTSGYVQRAAHLFPKQGAKTPWRVYQNYVRDLMMLRYGKLIDPSLEFSGVPTRR